jgi:RNA polymerase sigma factor (sigma-70 family)
MSTTKAADFDELIARVRAGSQEAAWELIQNYSRQILRVVRRRMPDQLRRKFDSQDFVQAAWASVFAHRSRLDNMDGEGEFCAFLASVATNKLITEIRRRIRGEKYRLTHEEPFNEFHEDTVYSRQNETPSQVAIARERWSQLMAKQSERNQQIIKLKYDGHTIRDIAKQLDLHEGTVQRVLREMFHGL